MWEADKSKAHVAGLDAEGNRLTSYASSIMMARLFGGIMYIDIEAIEESKVEKAGIVTQVGFYDHCGHFYRTMKLDNPVEVRTKRRGHDTVKWQNLKIILTGDITT